jgi:hypothetical protein
MSPSQPTRWSRLRREWLEQLESDDRSAVLAWGAFTITFAALRSLTHWIHAGHGPEGGGISLGSKHFHHYNIGIALLTSVGAVGLRGSEEQRRHPLAAVAFGAANAMIVDELALLLDLEDVYWAREGRISVDIGVGVIAILGSYLAAIPFWRYLATPGRDLNPFD